MNLSSQRPSVSSGAYAPKYIKKRPPRIFRFEGKNYTLVNDEVYLVNSKREGNSRTYTVDDIRDINRLQRLINQNAETDIRYKVNNPPPQMINRNLPQVGLGKINRGLTNFDIEKVMKELDAYKHGFLGCYPCDKIGDIPLPKNKHPFSFIVNTDTSEGHGEHWIACWIDPYYKKQICLFDSFGDFIDDDIEFAKIFQIELKRLIDKLKLPYMLKMKMNMIQQQPILDSNGKPSTTCGFYSMKFILDMIRGEGWKIASGLNDIDTQRIIDLKTKQINNFKNILIKDGFI
jgi:hypothetical protein